MAETLLSVGIDVGTTSTQTVFSRLVVENRAGSFSVPELEIGRRQVIWRSPVLFTPLIREELVDARALKEMVDGQYRDAGIRKEDVDTGAIIITGETSRKENARNVLEALAEYAGDFVVAQAGPDLESVLAAKGAGAVACSAETGERVLHMDIGGGTTNLALIENGVIRKTGCVNIGGRLLKIGPGGRLGYVSPVLAGIFQKQAGEVVTRGEVQKLAEKLVGALEAAAGLNGDRALLRKLRTQGVSSSWEAVEGPVVLSFSGGVADCVETERPWLAFGDIGPELGQAIRRSRLCQGKYRLGEETIRATVIGAGCHSARLSGSTVFHQNMTFPLKNLPVVCRARELDALDGPGVLVLPEADVSDYRALATLAEGVPAVRPLILVLERDAAKALGQLLALRMGRDAQILCLDRLRLQAGDYLDVGAPVGPALPVVVKTLILNT